MAEPVDYNKLYLVQNEVLDIILRLLQTLKILCV